MSHNVKQFLIFTLSLLPLKGLVTAQEADTPDTYTLVVEGFDWGPAVSKVVLDLGETLEQPPAGSFSVTASRDSELATLPEATTSGPREVLMTFLSDASGNRTETGRHLTLVLSVGPGQPLTSPFHYARNERVRGNFWVDYRLLVVHRPSLRTWTSDAGRTLPLVDRFDLSGKYEQEDGQPISYAWYRPDKVNGKHPLLIWLHGGGEGGSDPTIALLGNRAANYASDELQVLFGGAFVLVPQAPTFWMDSGSGVYTRGETEDIYHRSLMSLIEDFVAANPEIDRNRIYVGGCSNGGYMSLKLILQNPDYFAAGYISALAYQASSITDAQLRRIRKVPIWFIHSKDDPVTLPEETAVPTYRRLLNAGARNVHFSYFDHVTDITGQYGGPDYHYSGHWSWIYSHANKARLDFDGEPVRIGSRPVTIMEWLAAQSR